jgi:hypothetical protein
MGWCYSWGCVPSRGRGVSVRVGCVRSHCVSHAASHLGCCCNALLLQPHGDWEDSVCPRICSSCVQSIEWDPSCIADVPVRPRVRYALRERVSHLTLPPPSCLTRTQRPRALNPLRRLHHMDLYRLPYACDVTSLGMPRVFEGTLSPVPLPHLSPHLLHNVFTSCCLLQRTCALLSGQSAWPSVICQSSTQLLSFVP